MNNSGSGWFSVLFFLFVVFVVGGIILSQFVTTLGDLSKKDEQIKVFTTELEKATAENIQLTNDLVIEKDARKQAEEALGLANQSAETCASSLAQANTDRERLTRQVNGLTAERSALNAQITTLTSERDALTQTVGKASGERDALIQQVNDLTIARDAQIKLADHWMSEQASAQAFIPGTGTEPEAAQDPAAGKFAAQPWWAITIGLVIACFAGFEVLQRQTKKQSAPHLHLEKDEVQVKMSRAQLEAYLRWQREQRK